MGSRRRKGKGRLRRDDRLGYHFATVGSVKLGIWLGISRSRTGKRRLLRDDPACDCIGAEKKVLTAR